MEEIGALEANATFRRLLDRVEKGEVVIITRDGKRIARLVPDQPVSDRERALAAANDIIAQSRGITLGEVTLQELIK